MTQLISLESKGLEAAQSMLKQLEKMGATKRSVDLLSRGREEGGAANADIIGWLKDTGRDFITPDDDMTEAIGIALRDEMEEGLRKENARQAKRKDKATAAGKAFKAKGAEQIANSVMTRAFKNAMFTAMRIMTERIETQTTADGTLEELTEAYAKYKQAKFGFKHPIGKATGQLLDNLAENVANIKVRRG